MLSGFGKNRCQKCKTERKVRFCLRFNKDLGWQCCNNTRIDKKCPGECAYHPHFEAVSASKDADPTKPKSPFPALKTDSRSEFEHFVSLYLDLWIHHKLPELNDLSPLEYAKQDKEAMLSWLRSFQYPENFPLGKLLAKLDIDLEIKTTLKPDPEAIVQSYLEQVIKWEWDGLYAITPNDLKLEGTAANYASLISDIPQLRKTKEFDVLSSGISQDRSVAFVFVELNHSVSWTLILIELNGQWHLRQHLASDPQAYYAQNKLYNDLAQLLSQQNSVITDSDRESSSSVIPNPDRESSSSVIPDPDRESINENITKLLKDAFKTYPDCADLYYYQGLYLQGIKQFDQAKTAFFNAITLDNRWTAPQYHLALLHLQSHDYDKALYWFEQQHNLEPSDPRTLNNVAACYINLGQKDKARDIWTAMLTQYPEFTIAKDNLDRLSRDL